MSTPQFQQRTLYQALNEASFRVIAAELKRYYEAIKQPMERKA